MNTTANYTERKKYVKFDDEHCLLYLNEEATDVVVNEETGETAPGYKYTGDQPDGSTKICVSGVTDKNRRAKFIAGLIGREFDVDAQIAILANDSDTPAHADEMERFKACRADCKTAVDELLARNI